MATGIPPRNGISNNKFVSKVELNYPEKRSLDYLLSENKIDINLIKSGNESNKNILVFGENINSLQYLIVNKKLSNKIKLIYIDPPYSTRTEFLTRNQDNAYSDLLSGGEYIEEIRKRIFLLKELLSSDGSIYIHLDEKMVFQIKIIMDEIFGINNFRSMITRKKCNPKNFTSKCYGNLADYILFYTNSENYTWNRPFAEWSEEKSFKEYQYIEEQTGRRYKKVPIHAPGIRNGETGKVWRGLMPPPGKHWQFMPSRLDEMDKKGEIYWSPTGNPRRKIYLDESFGIPVQNIWLDYKDAHNQNIKITGYPTEKNPDILERIISTSSNTGDIILDCYCGSGTTLAVSSKLGRKWIGIDSSEEAIKATLRRFSVGLEKMGDYVNNKTEKEIELFKYKEDHKIINDFDLYVEGEGNEKIEIIIHEWMN